MVKLLKLVCIWILVAQVFNFRNHVYKYENFNDTALNRHRATVSAWRAKEAIGMQDSENIPQEIKGTLEVIALIEQEIQRTKASIDGIFLRIFLGGFLFFALHVPERGKTPNRNIYQGEER